MVKRLTKIGNSLGLVLERRLLERLGIDASTPIEVSTDGSIIVLAPKRSGRRSRLKAVSDAVLAEYAGAFQKLAE